MIECITQTTHGRDGLGSDGNDVREWVKFIPVQMNHLPATHNNITMTSTSSRVSGSLHFLT